MMTLVSYCGKNPLDLREHQKNLHTATRLNYLEKPLYEHDRTLTLCPHSILYMVRQHSMANTHLFVATFAYMVLLALLPPILPKVI